MTAQPVKNKPLRVGIVCEGQRGCAETQVFPQLVKLICPEAICGDAEIVPSGNRPNVLKKAPIIASLLLESGCDVVFVMWDVFPEWRDEGGSTDCEEHRQTLDAGLTAAKMNKKPIVPVAIREELEAWLLCDGAAIEAAIGKLVTKKRVPSEKKPDTVSNPKARLKEIYKQFRRGKGYNDVFSASQIAANIRSLEPLRASKSFARFERKLKEWCDKHNPISSAVNEKQAKADAKPKKQRVSDKKSE